MLLSCVKFTLRYIRVKTILLAMLYAFFMIARVSVTLRQHLTIETFQGVSIYLVHAKLPWCKWIISSFAFVCLIALLCDWLNYRVQQKSNVGFRNDKREAAFISTNSSLAGKGLNCSLAAELLVLLQSAKLINHTTFTVSHVTSLFQQAIFIH